jgi:adenosylcobinamide-GDP ribazoletransferase
MFQFLRAFLRQLGGAIVFYTCIPLPHRWPFEFRGIATLAPVVGLMLGALLTSLDFWLTQTIGPTLLTNVLVVTIWLSITGGLHFDGAMDAADGLAVPDPSRRLVAMADSRSGAFGVMAAIVILGLKVAALAGLSVDRGWVLLAACGWGRWGQLAAIVRHPYLRTEGKGALHKAAIKSAWAAVPSFGLMLGVSGVLVMQHPDRAQLAFGLAIGGGAIGLALGDWFNWQLGGHTGDTYGAVVEWTEVGILVLANFLA